MDIADTTILASWVQGITASQPLYADNFMTCVLLACGLILATIMADRKCYLSRLIKSFFLPRDHSGESVRTSNIIYMRVGMYLITFASVGLLLTAYAAEKTTSTIGNALLWATASAATTLLYLLRMTLFLVTDRIFLDPPTRQSWELSYANWIILSAIPLYLAAAATIFLDLPQWSILPILGTCVILLEICLLYRAFHIFSGKKYGILQLFAYLCTLELIPLLIAAKALVLYV